MKAVYLQEPGGPEALVYGDMPNPENAPGEVMLRVHGSALNRSDMGSRTRGRSGQSPRILGMDVAGEIVSISPDANTSLQVGDRVLLENRVKCHVCESCVAGLDQYCSNQKRIGVDLDGGHAEYITAPAMNTYKFRDSMSFAEAAAIPLAGHTAWQCMVVQGQVKSWDDVLIQAAGSGVASMAIQIAKMVGARVITTAGSDWKLEEAKKWGADEGNQLSGDDQHKRTGQGANGRQGSGPGVRRGGRRRVGAEFVVAETRGTAGDYGGYVGRRTPTWTCPFCRGRPLHLMGSGGTNPPELRRPDEVRKPGRTNGHRGPDLPVDRCFGSAPGDGVAGVLREAGY